MKETLSGKGKRNKERAIKKGKYNAVLLVISLVGQLVTTSGFLHLWKG
jgi:hypothetical protein